jgi:hypothetical protein
MKRFLECWGACMNEMGNFLWLKWRTESPEATCAQMGPRMRSPGSSSKTLYYFLT